MDRNDICTNMLEIIAGTSNMIQPAYMEASEDLKKNDDKTIKYLRNFIASIENVASKNGAVDKRICDSRGNMKEFTGYDNIEKSLNFLSTHKTPSGNAMAADLKSIAECLEKYQPIYTEGYQKKSRLLVLEYECALYLLITGLSMALSFNFQVSEANGTTVTVAKPKAYFGVTGKKIHEMAEELKKKNHGSYLEEVLKATNKNNSVAMESYYTEGTLDTVNTVIDVIKTVFAAGKEVGKFAVRGISALKSTLFGIIPLIRGVIWLSYRRKADTIVALEQNVAFLEENIEHLNKKASMDPTKKKLIIKRQKAKIEAYQKRAEKLRAQLEEGEREASEAIKKEDSRMKDTSDDFVLECVEKMQQKDEFDDIEDNPYDMH